MYIHLIIFTLFCVAGPTPDNTTGSYPSLTTNDEYNYSFFWKVRVGLVTSLGNYPWLLHGVMRSGGFGQFVDPAHN